jgi:hypothetical protein
MVRFSAENFDRYFAVCWVLAAEDLAKWPVAELHAEASLFD